MKLDVGCGGYPKGDVNVDLFIGETPHGKRHFIDIRKTRNFVNADIHRLPFRENAFSETSCFHVLEHRGVKFVEALNELLRVTNGIVEIEIPHRYGDRGKIKVHNKFFSRTSIQKLLRNMGLSFQLDEIFDFFPHRCMPILRLPKLLRVKIACAKI